MKDSYKGIYVLGDTHGSWISISQFLHNSEIKDSLIIHVGDVGVGFHSKEFDANDFSRKITKWLTPNNNKMICIRGNHDDPELFVKDSFLNTERITLLPDYTYKTINGKKFLFVGGAVSIDRQWRRPTMDYWEDEGFVLTPDYKNLDKCDVLIVHTAPNVCYPHDGLGHLAPFFVGDPTLKDELMKERENLTLLYNHVTPSYIINGHFHKSNMENINGCIHKTLDINEFWELRA